MEMEGMNTVGLFFVGVIGRKMIVWFVGGMNSVIGVDSFASEMIVELIWFVEGMEISFGVSGRIVCNIQVLLNAKRLRSYSLVHYVPDYL